MPPTVVAIPETDWSWQNVTTPRVLVTGATGMVGRAIVRALHARRRPVRILARDRERARALFGSSVEITVGDLGSAESLRRACEGVGEIYHAAAALGFHAGGDAEIVETNVEGTKRLLAAARASGVPQMIYTSSVAVYGDDLSSGVTEQTPVNPSSAYGRSKVLAETLMREAVTAGMRCMIVRPCVIYGPGDRYFLPQSAWAVRLPVLPLPDGGRHVVDLVHADDVAAAHLLVMEAGQPGEAYNVTDGERYPLGDLLRWIAQALGRSPHFLPLSRRAARGIAPLVRAAGVVGRIPQLAHIRQQDVAVFFGDYHYDISKIASLGFAPRIHARAGLQSVLAGSLA